MPISNDGLVAGLLHIKLWIGHPPQPLTLIPNYYLDGKLA